MSGASADASAPAVRQISAARPFAWLALGWRDFTRAGWPSGFHGLVVATGGLLILAVAVQFTVLLPGAVSGFVLVGPILATGLYDISRRLAAGQSPHLGQVIPPGARVPVRWCGSAYCSRLHLWVLASMLLFGLFVQHAPIDGLYAFLRYDVREQGNLRFAHWLVLGGSAPRWCSPPRPSRCSCCSTARSTCIPPSSPKSGQRATTRSRWRSGLRLS